VIADQYRETQSTSMARSLTQPSSPQRSDAAKIFSDVIGINAKGFGTIVNNWGYAEASYSVV
jgi:hypothetical protein